MQAGGDVAAGVLPNGGELNVLRFAISDNLTGGCRIDIAQLKR